MNFCKYRNAKVPTCKKVLGANLRLQCKRYPKRPTLAGISDSCLSVCSEECFAHNRENRRFPNEGPGRSVGRKL
jgi:hypothetical protein